jgi:hypothetical protein
VRQEGGVLNFRPASAIMWEWTYSQANFYYRYAWQSWEALGPIGYVSILMFVGVFGFLAMAGKKRH